MSESKFIKSWPKALGREWPLAKILACEGGLAGRGKGVPQLSEAAPPPSTIHRLFLYIMYKVEGAGAMAMEAGIGARWGRETVTK